MKRFLFIAILSLVYQLTHAQVRITNTNQLFINHSGSTIGSGDFVISRNGGTFVGMYTNSNLSTDGKPFYGYSIDGIPRCYTYFADPTSDWRLNINSEDIINASSSFISLNKDIGINTNQKFNSFTEFTIKSNSNTFGGMYVDVNSVNGLPFYGYAISGTETAFHYFDNLDEKWKLFVVENTPIEVSKDAVNLNALLILNEMDGSQASEGTIYYENDAFWGVTNTGIKRLDNLNSFDTPTGGSNQSLASRLDQLEKENKELKELIRKLSVKITK